MVDHEVFARRLERLDQLLGDLHEVADTPEPAFLASRPLQAQAERWAHLAFECAIDLGNHALADRGAPAAGTNRQTFEKLGATGLLEPGFAARLADWAGLRNVLVHLYLDVDHRRLLSFLRDDLGDLQAFARAMGSLLD